MQMNLELVMLLFSEMSLCGVMSCWCRFFSGFLFLFCCVSFLAMPSSTEYVHYLVCLGGILAVSLATGM